MHLFVIRPWATCLFFVFVAILAALRGGWRERSLAIAQLVEMIISLYACGIWNCHVSGKALMGPAVWRFLLDDTAILALCLFCALRADRYWVIVASSFALLGVVSDLAVYIPGVSLWAFMSASLVWSYAVGLAVLWGVLTHRPSQTAPRRRISAGSRP